MTSKLSQTLHKIIPSRNKNTNLQTTTETMSSLTGKVALVTGGSKGIGAAISERLASMGANVVINYSSDSSAAEEIASKIKSQGLPEAFPHKANAASIPEIETMVDAVVKKYGKIDILIPCAGVLPMKTIYNTTEEDFERTFALNVKGPYFLVQKAVPHMPQGSRIVLFSTTLCTASTVSPAYLLYNATKGSVEQMTRVLAKDLASKGITVNAAAPGPTGTELFLRGKSQEMIDGIGKMNPNGRIGTPEEVADAVTLLCGEQSRWVTGQVLRINGGMA